MAQTNAQGHRRYLDLDIAQSQIGALEDVRSMLVMLQESLLRDISEITRLLAAHDVRGANLLLHPLKGFVPIFCGPELCEHVTRVETLSKSGGSAEVGAAYAALAPELSGLLDEVTAFLEG